MDMVSQVICQHSSLLLCTYVLMFEASLLIFLCVKALEIERNTKP